jgi:hypothetical protein
MNPGTGETVRWMSIDWDESGNWQQFDESWTIPDPAWTQTELQCWGTHWTADGDEYYTTELTASPDEVFFDMAAAAGVATEGTVGSLAVGEWGWDAVNSRLYVRLDDNSDPNAAANTVYIQPENFFTATRPELHAVAVIHFDETSGSIEEKVSGTMGVPTGISYQEAGIWSYAAGLDSGDTIIWPWWADLETESITVAAWIKPDLYNADTPSGTTPIISRPGSIVPWEICLYSTGYMGMRCYVDSQWQGATDQIRIDSLINDEWNLVGFSYDAATGVLLAACNGTAVWHEVLSNYAALPTEPVSGLMVNCSDLPFDIEELVILPVAATEVQRRDMYLRGVTSVVMQVSRDGGTTWTDENGIDGGYIYDPANLDLGAASETLLVETRLATADYRYAPNVRGIDIVYGRYPDDASFVIPSTAAAISGGMPVSLTAEMGADNEGEAAFRLSPNRVLWYYYDESLGQWRLSPNSTYGATTTNTALEMQNAITSWIEEFGDEDNLYVQCFLLSTGYEYVEIDQLGIAHVDATLVVTSPALGAIWEFDDTKTITWSSGGNVSGAWDLFFSVDDGVSWSGIATGVSGSSYEWTIPAAAESAAARIKIADSEDANIADVSDSMTIIPPEVRFATPYDQERILSGVAYDITWIVRGGLSLSDNCVIDYRLPGGNWVVIADGINGMDLQLSSPFSVPVVSYTDVEIRFRDLDNEDYTDTNLFDIAMGYDISVPIRTYAGTYMSVSWLASAGLAGQVDILYSTDDGANWTYAKRTASATGENECDVLMPNTPAAVSLKLQNPWNNQIEDAAELILAGIRISAPAGGVSVADGDPMTIAWTSYGAGNAVAVEYATSVSLGTDPTTWVVIDAAAANVDGNNSLEVTISAMATTRARIRVRSLSDGQLIAISPEFTVTP